MKKITFLLLSAFFVLTSVSAAEYENLYVVGDGCEAGWSPDRASEMTQESDGIFTWTGTLYEKSGSKRFKFIVARDWHPSITCRLDVEGHLLVEGSGEYELYVRPDGETGYDNAFQVPATGEYTITVNLNTMKMTCIKTGDVPDPTPDLTVLYMSGSALSADGNWDYDNPVEMDMLDDGVFTWTGNLYNAENVDSGNEFKFLNQLGTWDKTICSKKDTTIAAGGVYDLHFRPYEYSPDDYKFKVTAAGIYTIDVDLNTMKMSVMSQTGTARVGSDVLCTAEVAGNTVTVLNGSNEFIRAAGIFDVTGKCLNLVSNAKGSVILAENLSTGVYIVKIRCGNQKHVQKIMVK